MVPNLSDLLDERTVALKVTSYDPGPPCSIADLMTEMKHEFFIGTGVCYRDRLLKDWLLSHTQDFTIIEWNDSILNTRVLIIRFKTIRKCDEFTALGE